MRALTLLALIALVLPVSAQPSFGVKAGLNVANVSSSDDNLGFDVDEGVDNQARLGFVGGLTADIPLSAVLSFRPELLYSQKGYTLETIREGGLGSGAFDGAYTTAVNYIEVPLLLAYRFPSSSGLEVDLEAGPTLAYKINETIIRCRGDYDDDDSEFVIETFCDQDSSAFEDFDLSGAVGLTVGSGPFGVGLRYTHSILSVKPDDPFFDFSLRNQAFAVTAHYRFGGGRRY